VTKSEAVVATSVVLAGVGLAILVGTASFVRRHVTSQTASPTAAAAEIERQLTHFAGQQPLREIRDGQDPLKHPPPGSSTPAHTLRALIFNARSHHLVHVDIPFAVLRFMKGGGFRYLGELTPLQDDTEFERDRIDLPLPEVDGQGTMLLVDHSHPSGARILVWVD
jgi:hypothetical protein